MKNTIRFFGIIILITIIGLTSCTENISECSHNWEMEITNPATEETDGLKTEICTKCGEKSGKTEVIPKLDNGGDPDCECGECDECNPECEHEFPAEWNLTKPATCAEEGSEELVCSVCDTHDEDSPRVIGKLEHEFSETTPATCLNDSIPGTCTLDNCGVTNPEAVVKAGHIYNWTINPGNKTCTNGDCTEVIPVALGDPGPAGGIIFYIDTTGFTITDDGSTAYYLEAAPDSMETRLTWASLEFIPPSSGGTGDWLDIPGTGTAIGTGRKNTALILAEDAAAPAALACKNFFVEGYEAYNDWFLPSYNELIQLHNRRADFNFTIDDFVSSSEIYNMAAYGINNFSVDGGYVTTLCPKNSNRGVHAIRAF